MPTFAEDVREWHCLLINVHDFGSGVCAACQKAQIIPWHCSFFDRFPFTAKRAGGPVSATSGMLYTNPAFLSCIRAGKHKRHAHNGALAPGCMPRQVRSPVNGGTSNGSHFYNSSRACLAPRVPSCGAKSSAGRTRRRPRVDKKILCVSFLWVSFSPKIGGHGHPPADWGPAAVALPADWGPPRSPSPPIGTASPTTD
jgi:hypothetical protein